MCSILGSNTTTVYRAFGNVLDVVEGLCVSCMQHSDRIKEVDVKSTITSWSQLVFITDTQIGGGSW